MPDFDLTGTITKEEVQDATSRNYEATIGHDLRFVREMSRLFFDRSMDELNFTDGDFEIFTDTDDILSSSGVVFSTGPNGKAYIGQTPDLLTASEGNNVQVDNYSDIQFNGDGTRLIAITSSRLYWYDLSTPFDISTLGSEQGPQDVPSSDDIEGFEFNNDGTSLVTVEQTAQEFREYHLSTAYDPTTITSTGTTLGAKGSKPSGVTFGKDGTRLYQSNSGNNETSVYQWNLSTAYDISTASYETSLSIGEDSFIQDVVVSNDGTVLIIGGDSPDQMVAYDLSTPYEVDSGSYDTNYENFSTTVNAITLSNAENQIFCMQGSNLDEVLVDVEEKSGTGSLSTDTTVGFTPTTAVLEDTTEGELVVDYTLEDGNGNTVAISDSDVGSEVDTSALSSGSITLTASLDSAGSNRLRDFAIYYE